MGRIVSAVFLAPHPDDEALFGAFTLLRHKPHVIVCTDRGIDRLAETAAACGILGVTFEQWHDPIDELVYALEERRYERIFAPQPEVHGDPDHNAVGQMAYRHFGAAVTHYMTYTTAGKSKGRRVEYELPWIGLKLRALACYPSQYGDPSHAPHFVRGLEEFYAS
jgi:LmbE family N-acetylglucosaminyl deacetylase